MHKSNVVVLITKEDIDNNIKNVTTMEVFNVGDVGATINGATLKAGERKTIVVADGTITDIDIKVVFGSAFSGYNKKIEFIYKKIMPSCGN